ncbi:hypothetical protein HK101_006691, partial [Irineochytrium annulatum]
MVDGDARDEVGAKAPKKQKKNPALPEKSAERAPAASSSKKKPEKTSPAPPPAKKAPTLVKGVKVKKETRKTTKEDAKKPKDAGDAGKRNATGLKTEMKCEKNEEEEQRKNTQPLKVNRPRANAKEAAKAVEDDAEEEDAG